MVALGANVLQLGMLGLGVSLLVVWINYLKARATASALEPLARSPDSESAAPGKGEAAIAAPERIPTIAGAPGSRS